MIRPLGLAAGLLAGALSALLLPGCGGPSPDDPLPPETDLYAYSLAVASRVGLVLPSSSVRARFLVGRVHERFGFDEKALEVYAEVVKKDPEFADAYQRMGFILSQRKDRMNQAIEAYQNALRTRPGTPGIYSRLGLVFMHLGRFEDAHRALDEEIRAGTADHETHYFKGQVYALEGKHADAVESYRRTIELSPEHRMALYGLTQSLRVLGKAEEEKAALERFKEVKRKEDEATQNAGGSRKDGPDREKRRFASETWLDAAEIYITGVSQTKDPRERSELLGRFLEGVEASIRLDPSYPQPRELLVQHFRHMGDMERAVVACEAAFQAIPRDPDIARAAYELAGALVEDENTRARPDLAFRVLSAAVAAAPDVADAHRELARLILFKLEKPELIGKAIEHARRAVEIRPDPPSYDVLAYALFRAGRAGEAAVVLEEGLRRNPEDETLRERLRRFQESRSGQGNTQPHAGGGAGPP
jgi:tetratricopeptide (TPR) repeat protein